MKIKLLVLLTGTFLAVAYLVGCGGGGNNGSGTTCPAGQTLVNGVCQVGYGANSYSQCLALGQGTPAYTNCMAQMGCGGGVGGGYGGGYGQPTYGQPTYGQPGYGTAGYPNQNCGGVGGPGYIAGPGYSPYPPQGGAVYMPYGPYPPPYYGYGPGYGYNQGIQWGVSFGSPSFH